MSKYKIAWMPGDGVGHDVMEAARIVLDRLKLDAEYVPCDIGGEFFPLPEPVYTVLCANPKMKKWKDKAGLENIALSTRIMSKQGCTNICKQAFEFAKKTGRKRVTLIEKPNVLRETGGLMMRC